MKEYLKKNFESAPQSKTSMMSADMKLNETFQANNSDKLNSHEDLLKSLT